MTQLQYVRMDSPADHLLDSVIAAETAEGRQTVTAFTRGVERRVQERVSVLQEECGGDVRVVGGAAMARARNYAVTKRSLLDPSYEVGATEAEGAAAWYEPGTGRTVFSFAAMNPDSDAGYWQRVRRHEEVHQGQAHAFNSGTLVIGDDVIDVLPVLTEGQATQEQPAADLTPDYLDYQQTYRRIASLLGSRAPLDAAVDSGDIVGLQKEVDVVTPHPNLLQRKEGI